MSSVDAGAAMEKIRAAGLLRTQGLIGGKWVDAYDGKTLEVTLPPPSVSSYWCLREALWAAAVTSRGIRGLLAGAPRLRVVRGRWGLEFDAEFLSSFCSTAILAVHRLVVRA
jgi:hypothetical protein